MGSLAKSDNDVNSLAAQLQNARLKRNQKVSILILDRPILNIIIFINIFVYSKHLHQQKIAAAVRQVVAAVIMAR